jgi:bisphosphoglycerate-independent phosphoglycerate mutase (AlkP superfamily)
VIDPHDGYDFKAGLGKREIFASSAISGMHTYSDALLYIGGVSRYEKRPVIWDIMPTIMGYLQCALPGALEGRSLIQPIQT